MLPHHETEKNAGSGFFQQFHERKQSSVHFMKISSCLEFSHAHTEWGGCDFGKIRKKVYLVANSFL